MQFRSAEPHEHEFLTDIAIRSEAYWGYDTEFMESFKSLYKVTEEFISSNPTFVMEEQGTIIGFYSIFKKANETSLEYFYIEPHRIGKGYGRMMWQHMINLCKQMEIHEMILVTSPQAKEFYIRMGAALVGEVESLVLKGRIIPKLVYTLEK